MQSSYIIRHLSLLSFFFCLLNGFFLHAELTQYEGEVIERIDIQIMNLPEGSTFDTSGILTRMVSQEGSPFYQAEFDNDLKTLVQDFDRLEPTVDSIDGKIYITLKIWPKPVIRTLTWYGNEKVKSKRLLKELGISPGSLFDRLAFNKAFHKLKAYYVRKGFFEAELQYDPIIDPLTNEVDIQITIQEGRAGRIKNIRFVNFNKKEKEALTEMIMSKEYCFFTSWFTDEGTYREEMMQQDELQIVSYLHNEGFADAKVFIDISESFEKDRILVTITACKGELYKIGNINFSGNTLFSDDAIWECIPICEGDSYSPEFLRSASESIRNLYGKYGFIDAFINYEPKLRPDSCVYDIDFTIEEGQQYRVGIIKVFGNCSTNTHVILHETLLIPGETFNVEKLQKTEERLQNIGFFSSVNVYAVKSEGESSLGENYRDVHIEVEETSTGHIGAFFGFSTVESIFGGFNITESNFNYKGLSCLGSRGLSALRGGGEYAHFTTTIGKKSRSYVLSWSKPYFNDTPWTVGFDIERSSNRYVSKDYDIESSGLTIRGMYPLNQFMKYGAHYRLKYTVIDVSESHPSHMLKEEARNSGLISAVGSSFIYDSTNHPLRPTDGFKSKLEGECAGVGGSQVFLKFGYINSYYWQFPCIDEKGVWKFRADAHFIQPLGNRSPHSIPIDERYFLGGDDSIRGYRPYKLGPEYPEGDPRGGISMQLLSLEYSRPLFKRVEGFTFIDSGHLDIKRWHFGRMNTSVGFGFKIAVFPNAPPLTLGMGFPINPQNRGQVKRFFLSVGGKF